MRRLICAFVVRILHKTYFLMAWLICNKSQATKRWHVIFALDSRKMFFYYSGKMLGGLRSWKWPSVEREPYFDNTEYDTKWCSASLSDNNSLSSDRACYHHSSISLIWLKSCWKCSRMNQSPVFFLFQDDAWGNMKLKDVSILSYFYPFLACLHNVQEEILYYCQC